MIDGLPTTYPDAIGANRPRDARKGVDRLVNAGVDLIKVYTRVDPTAAPRGRSTRRRRSISAWPATSA